MLITVCWSGQAFRVLAQQGGICESPFRLLATVTSDPRTYVQRNYVENNIGVQSEVNGYGLMKKTVSCQTWKIKIVPWSRYEWLFIWFWGSSYDVLRLLRNGWGKLHNRSLTTVKCFNYVRKGSKFPKTARRSQSKYNGFSGNKRLRGFSVRISAKGYFASVSISKRPRSSDLFSECFQKWSLSQFDCLGSMVETSCKCLFVASQKWRLPLLQ